MTALTETAKEGINRIQEKIRENKGQVTLCYREIDVPEEVTGDFIPPISHQHNHYETGIINGELERVELTHQKVDLPNLTLHKCGSYFDKDYRYFPELAIPIQRKLSGFLPFSDRFQFDIKDLEGLADGSILMALNELPGEEFASYKDVLSFLGYYGYHQEPRLINFGLHIGDEEVEKFLTERKIKNLGEFFDVLKNPKFVKEKIDNYYYRERKELGEKLTITTNEAVNIFRKIKDLERSVIHASLKFESEDGHTYSYWGEEVHNYFKLKELISEKIKTLNEYIKTGTENSKLYAFTNNPFIEGDIIGFPEKTDFNSYSAWITSSLIPNIKDTFEKLDAHLREEKIKADSR